jgi:hypothetical protein
MFVFLIALAFTAVTKLALDMATSWSPYLAG